MQEKKTKQNDIRVGKGMLLLEEKLCFVGRSLEKLLIQTLKDMK